MRGLNHHCKHLRMHRKEEKQQQQQTNLWFEVKTHLPHRLFGGFAMWPISKSVQKTTVDVVHRVSQWTLAPSGVVPP